MTMTIPTTATPATTASAPATGKSASASPENPGATLGKNDFLKLMIAQLQAQNPLSPTDSTQYVSELAQFTELEQMTNLAQTSSQSVGAQDVAQAVALIGHTVSYRNPTTGVTAEGAVQSVQISSSGATLTVGGAGGIEPASITEVSS